MCLARRKENNSNIEKLNKESIYNNVCYMSLFIICVLMFSTKSQVKIHTYYVIKEAPFVIALHFLKVNSMSFM